MKAVFFLDYLSDTDGVVNVKYNQDIKKEADKMNFLKQVALLIGCINSSQEIVVVNPCPAFPEDDDTDLV